MSASLFHSSVWHILRLEERWLLSLAVAVVVVVIFVVSVVVRGIEIVFVCLVLDHLSWLISKCFLIMMVMNVGGSCRLC